MSKIRALFSDVRLLHLGIYAEIVGVILLCVLTLTKDPMLSAVCMPAGGGLFCLGWLAWVWVFLKNL